MNKKISTPIAIGIILVLAILVGGFTLWQYGEIDKEESNIPEAQLPEKEEVANETAGWRTYRNEEYGFEVKYPEDWKTISKFPGRFGPGQTEFVEGVNPQSFLFAPDSKDIDRNEADLVLYIAPPEIYICSDYMNVSDDNINDFLEKNINNNEIEFCKLDVYFRFSLNTSQKEILNQMLSTFKFIEPEDEITQLKRECAESYYQGDCYLSLAKELRDPLICEEIILYPFSLDGPFQVGCYGGMAIFLKDPLICNNIAALPYRNSCLIKVAYELRDSSVCDYLIEAEFKVIEMGDLGYDTHHSSRWRDLGSKKVKEDCIQISQDSEPRQRYQDKKHGWEITLPKDFLISESVLYESLTFESPEGLISTYWPGPQKYYAGFFWIDIEELKEEQTLDEWVVNRYRSKWGLKKENFEQIFPDGKFRNSDEWPEEIPVPLGTVMQSVTVGEEIPAIKSYGTMWQIINYLAYYIKHNNTIIIITTNSNIDSPLFNQMLSTFKFIEEEIYSNNDFGFQFGYPKDWEILHELRYQRTACQNPEYREKNLDCNNEKPLVGLGKNKEALLSINLRQCLNVIKLPENNFICFDYALPDEKKGTYFSDTGERLKYLDQETNDAITLIKNTFQIIK